MSLNCPIKYMKLDVEDRIHIQRLRMLQASSFTLNITLYQGNEIIDLTDADNISLTYSDNDTFQETIIGSSSVPTSGVCTFNFTPANTANYGSFEFVVQVAETGGNTIVFPYGELILLRAAGTAVQGTLPTTGIQLIANNYSVNCSSSPLSVDLTDHAKTYVLDDSLACDFEFRLPTVTNPDAYVGTWYRFVSRNGPYTCTITAADNDTIDDSSAGGGILNVDETGVNPTTWSSIKIQLCANISGEAWWHAVEGRRCWSTV